VFHARVAAAGLLLQGVVWCGVVLTGPRVVGRSRVSLLLVFVSLFSGARLLEKSRSETAAAAMEGKKENRAPQSGFRSRLTPLHSLK